MNRKQFIKILNDYYSTSPPVKYVIAFDFDGVLCNSNYPFLGDEIKPICDFLRSIYDLDCYIILYTCRHDVPLDNALEWCDEHNLHFNYVNKNVPERVAYWGESDKLSYDMLIDDHAYNFNINDFTT